MDLKITNGFSDPSHSSYEVVERKGLGHPDTLADGIAEQIEIDYSLYCLEKFGVIPHHNFDKIIIRGGHSVQALGGSDFIEPIKVIFLGRASKECFGSTIPLFKIQKKAAINYLKRILPNLDVENCVEFESLTSNFTTKDNWFSPKSLEDLPEYSGQPKANDTATMISYWPLTISEELALTIEGYFYKLNSQNLPVPRFPQVGGDIKVMVVRNGAEYAIKINFPLISKYFMEKGECEKYVVDHIEKIKKYIESKYQTISYTLGYHYYMTTSGSCIDFGEEGAVGRGNKTHGIISSFRPNTMEAPAGKNCTYFIGKVWGFLTDTIAKEVYETFKTPCQVIMQANIHSDLYKPTHLFVQTHKEVDYEKTLEITNKYLSLGRENTKLILNTQHFLPRTNVYEE
ncbi:S-adenosylmethionine synthetase family protein [Streptococcus porcinus]|uniref:methionine adenosyltransferase n=1 Tax=Streptococcus porcinus TaxID=1340 RepID=UPI0010CAB8C5|nr:methionine adenosyltransferase [Streptococcus porcinus]VTS29316.1 S-adenosylmethionine synthetase family protein [Streptococcus porcinus]